jgi:hypothetical protein
MDAVKFKDLSSGAMDQGFCPLWGSVFLIPGVAAVLHDGLVPLGYLCERCLVLGPEVAAMKVEKRATLLRGLIEKARTERVRSVALHQVRTWLIFKRQTVPGNARRCV